MEDIKASILQVLPTLDVTQASNLSDQLFNNIGVESADDLRLVCIGDLDSLKAIQARKLLEKWQLHLPLHPAGVLHHQHHTAQQHHSVRLLIAVAPPHLVRMEVAEKELQNTLPRIPGTLVVLMEHFGKKLENLVLEKDSTTTKQDVKETCLQHRS
ncbi:hypothetical protein GQR58_015996 [Nymphon striatum]|nr:hypothetical protein GQR58_015996 [Nymphon striatum]